MNKNMQQEFTFFFLDGVHEDVDIRKVICYGGFFNTIPLEDLSKLIGTAKINLGLEEWMPIKWNFSDDVKRYYKKYWESVSSAEFEKKYAAIKKRSIEIRKELVKQTAEGIKILVSVFIDQRSYYHHDVLNWLNTNLFQRIGLNMNTATTNLLMCDFEHYKDPTRVSLIETYFHAYHKGKGYFSGPLKNRRAFPALAFSNAMQNPFLQLADILVGCVGSLAKTWVLDKNPENHAKVIFEAAKGSFVKNPTSSDIFRFGLVTKSEGFRTYMSNHGLL